MWIFLDEVIIDEASFFRLKLLDTDRGKKQETMKHGVTNSGYFICYSSIQFWLKTIKKYGGHQLRLSARKFPVGVLPGVILTLPPMEKIVLWPRTAKLWSNYFCKLQNS